MKKVTKRIDLKTLKATIRYNRETGVFTWRVRQRQIGGFAEIGSVAGFKETLGYWCIGLGRRQYKAHRLAWFYVYGIWPSDHIDHINGDRADNRIVNLRLGSPMNNSRNAKMKKNNTSGFKGVRYDSGRYMARIGVNYERIYLGRFDTPEEAHAAYVSAAQKYFGEFARAA